MSNKFYISDLHLGHFNIIRLCNRPFSSIEEMDQTLIENWNNKVTEKDEVYILGDLIFKNAKSPKYYLKQLKGKKIMIRGNHDKFLKDKQNLSYFESIHDMLSINDQNRFVNLCHYPMCEWNGFFRNSIHLYGHIHNNIENDAYRIMRNIKNAYNVGADILDFTPMTLDEVIECNKRFQKQKD